MALAHAVGAVLALGRGAGGRTRCGHGRSLGRRCSWRSSCGRSRLCGWRRLGDRSGRSGWGRRRRRSGSCDRRGASRGALDELALVILAALALDLRSRFGGGRSSFRLRRRSGGRRALDELALVVLALGRLGGGGAGRQGQSDGGGDG